MKNEEWIKLREAYIDWVAYWPEKSGIKELLCWRGYSLWWSTNLVAKDSYIRYGWLAKLCKRVLGKEIRLPNSNSHRRGPIFLIPLFFLDLARFLLVRLTIKPEKLTEEDIFFYSMDINLINKSGVVFDRQYSSGHSTLLHNDHEYGKNAAYLLKLDLLPLNLLYPRKWYREFRKKLLGFERPVYVINRHIRFIDICAIHFAVFRAWVCFSKLKRKDSFRSGCKIFGVSCDDILLDELEQSFFGPIQSSLMQAFMLKSFLMKRADKNTVMINYLETAANARPMYHFSKVSHRHHFVAMQHSTRYKNSLSFYHRQFELNPTLDKKRGIKFSPIPDYYFVHGIQFKNLVNQFFPQNRIKIIGVIKYDNYTKLLSDISGQRKIVAKKINKGDDKIILLAPSFGIDIVNIMNMFVGQIPFLPQSVRYIIAPHPIVTVEMVKKTAESMSVSVPFEYYPDSSTQELLFAADLVVCGYSSIALESMIFSVPSIRIVDNMSIPLTEDESGIPYVYNRNEFWNLIPEILDCSIKANLKDKDKLVADFFFKIDGRSMNRFWESIQDIT
jgi:CDP-glycerol glycerophosphotransferase (TagB/SpsB family)